MVSHQIYKLTIILIIFLSFVLTSLVENAELAGVSQCKYGPQASLCNNNKESKKLKVIAIFSILAASVSGVSLPLVTRKIPALGPDGDYFAIGKALASGVILAAGYMHVLPDSFADFNSFCLPRKPWRKFPFTTFIAMMALLTLMMDSYAMSWQNKSMLKPQENIVVETLEGGSTELEKESGNIVTAGSKFQLIRYQVIAQVLELGIVLHSVVISLAMGASDNKCTIRSLIAAICFHQLFEGMGLGGYAFSGAIWRENEMDNGVFFLGHHTIRDQSRNGVTNGIQPNESNGMILVGVLNACSAGLLNYMPLVDLLGADFLGPKLQGNMELQSSDVGLCCCFPRFWRNVFNG